MRLHELCLAEDSPDQTVVPDVQGVAQEQQRPFPQWQAEYRGDLGILVLQAAHEGDVVGFGRHDRVKV
jgi:hypothetical protein